MALMQAIKDYIRKPAPSPAAPTWSRELMRLLKPADWNSSKIVTNDFLRTSLTANILRISNSAILPGPCPRSDLPEASPAWLSTGYQLLVASAGAQLLTPQDGLRSGAGELWKHSVAAAVAGNLRRKLAITKTRLYCRAPS